MSAPPQSDDAELLRLLRRDARGGWRAFLDRYADFIFRHLQRLGFDYDEAMDRFVYVCEKLREDGCRRLRGVQRLGDDDELVPWLRTVVERMSISWLWSVEGRDRLPKAIAELPPRGQRIFELHFRSGLGPAAIGERLRVEEQAEIEPAEVFESLERILAALSASKRWKLLSRLLRRRPNESLSELAEGPRAWEPRGAEPNAEARLLELEQSRRLEAVLDTLPDRNRLVLQLRIEEALGYAEIAACLGLSESTVERCFREAIEQLRLGWSEATVGAPPQRRTRSAR